MKTSIRSSTRTVLCGSTLLALGCAFVFAVVATPALRATVESAQAATLPLSASFEKVVGADTAPYVLTLKNDSDKSVKASAKVLLAVAFHAESKARNVPEQVIEPGKAWTIAELSLGDRVVVTAEGFAPLELTVK
jgi:hypothetical protein